MNVLKGEGQSDIGSFLVPIKGEEVKHFRAQSKPYTRGDLPEFQPSHLLLTSLG